MGSPVSRSVPVFHCIHDQPAESPEYGTILPPQIPVQETRLDRSSFCLQWSEQARHSFVQHCVAEITEVVVASTSLFLEVEHTLKIVPVALLPRFSPSTVLRQFCYLW